MKQKRNGVPGRPLPKVPPRVFRVSSEPVHAQTFFFGVPPQIVPARVVVGRTLTSMTAISPVAREADLMMNANAFPEGVFPNVCRDLARECRDLLALMCHANVVVRDEVEADARMFLEMLCSYSGMVDEASAYRPALTMYFENLAYFSALMSELVAMKAALDQFTKLAKAALGYRTGEGDGFHKGTVGLDKVAGGKFINWLANGKDFPGRDDLVALLAQAARGWLTTAVEYRDALAHRGGIPGAHCSSLLFDRPVSKLQLQDVRPPHMPHGERVTDYCDGVRAKTLDLLRQAVRLVPGVDKSCVQ